MRPEATRPVIVVIEDEPRVLRVIRDTLVGRPVSIATAVDGHSGVDLVRRLQPALVLLDLALPDLHGWEVLGLIRELSPGLPVVIVTAQGDSATASEARRLGAGGFVSKPFRPAQLRRIVDQFIPYDVAEAV